MKVFLVNIHGKRREILKGLKAGKAVGWEQFGGMLNSKAGGNENTHIFIQTTEKRLARSYKYARVLREIMELKDSDLLHHRFAMYPWPSHFIRLGINCHLCKMRMLTR